MTETRNPQPVTADGATLPDGGKAKSIGTTVYILQALGWFTVITYIAAVIVNYVKQADVGGTWVESHFRWQIRTFWFSLLWTVVGVLTVPILVGYLTLLANSIWVIYRVIRGWLALNDGREMYAA